MSSCCCGVVPAFLVSVPVRRELDPARRGGARAALFFLDGRRHDGRAAFHLELQLLVGIERRQRIEVDAVAQRIGVVEVDLVDLHHGEVALAVLGGADLAFHRVAGAQAEFADLGRADIDVVGAGQVVGFHRAQVAEAVGRHLDGADAEDRLVGGRHLLEDGEHQLLAAHHRRAFDTLLLGECEQLGRFLDLEFLEVHGSSVWGGEMTHAPRPPGAVTVENRRRVVLEWAPSITAGEAAPGALGGAYIGTQPRPVKGLRGDVQCLPRAPAVRTTRKLPGRARSCRAVGGYEAPSSEKGLGHVPSSASISA